MIEWNRSPPSVLLMTANIYVELQTFLLLLDLVRCYVDVLQIRTQNSALIGSSDLQNQGSATSRIAFVVVNPRNSSSKEIIIDYLVGIEMKDDIVGFFSGEEIGVIRVFHGSQRAEIN
jgi:hypothetical protein